MKILLVAINSKYIHLNLAVRYLKEFCKDYSDIETREFTINDNINSVISEIYSEKADLILFSCYIWNIHYIYKITETLKKADSNIRIGLGGPEVSYNPKEILDENKNVDFIIFGEGELTFRELVTKIDNGSLELYNIDGIAYRQENRIVVNNPRSLIDNLDIINFPYEKEIDRIQNKMVYYESSRGCPFNCQYCLSSTTEGVRYFSMGRTKADLKKLVDAKVSQVKFVDRTFNCSKKRTLEILKYLIELNPDINFHFEITAELLDEEIMSLLKTAPEGLLQFEVGVQSTNDETLDIISRKSNFERLSKIVNTINSYKNIHLHLDLIAGLPKESYAQFAESFNDVYNLYPQMLQLGFLKALKGSGIRKMADKYGVIYNGYSPYEVIKTNDIAFGEILKLKDLEEILEKYYNSNRFQKSLKFIIDNFYGKPFDFYQDFSMYWRDNKLFSMQYNSKMLYTILLEFYKSKFGESEQLNELLKFDYLSNEHNYMLPDGILRYDRINLQEKTFDFLKSEDNIKRYLPEYISSTAKQIIKKVHVEVFRYDVLDENIFENIQPREKIILFNYEPKNKTFRRTNVYDISKDFIFE